MSEDQRKLLEDSIQGRSFGWENFVDQFLPQLTRVAEFAMEEEGHDVNDANLKQKVVSHIFNEFMRDGFRLLRDFNFESELATYLTAIAQRAAFDSLAGLESKKSTGNGRPASSESVADRSNE